jgi:Histidine kinase-, DNA gyrase B-, and HSP90-like ATPase
VSGLSRTAEISLRPANLLTLRGFCSLYISLIGILVAINVSVSARRIDAQGGKGLGLSLVKHIVNRHRGRLLIESVPKNGATFSACFPQAKTQVPA